MVMRHDMRCGASRMGHPPACQPVQPRPRPRLHAGLPLPYAYEPLLCEVLFGQMLRLPRPQFKPLMYSTLMVDLCKLRKLFPRAMSACVRWVAAASPGRDQAGTRQGPGRGQGQGPGSPCALAGTSAGTRPCLRCPSSHAPRPPMVSHRPRVARLSFHGTGTAS